MSPTLIIACEMMEDEVLLALERAFPAGERPPLVWLESGLHDRPQRLQEALQRLIDLLDEGARTGGPVELPSLEPGAGQVEERRISLAVEPPAQILLAMGFCGEALKGLCSREIHLVFPRVDDCIALFLNSGCSREEIRRDSYSYYLTKGWFCHKSSATEGFESMAARYGEERARQVQRLMFAAYERVSLIDTGAYDVQQWEGQSRAYAEDLEKDHRVVPGSIQLLQRLFAGPWDSEIVAVPPGEAIGFQHLFGG